MIAAAFLCKLVVTWLVTDFISGVIHWLEDSYGHPHMPIVGPYFTKPDLLHHYHPRKFVTNSWFSSSDLLLILCSAALLVALAIGRLGPMVFLGALLGVNANQIHKWCHRTPRENGALIVALQRLHLVQTPQEHHRHHLGKKDAAYCVLTDFLNPILDSARFWRALEWAIFAVFRIRKRDDDELIALVLAEDPGFLELTAPEASTSFQERRTVAPGRASPYSQETGAMWRYATQSILLVGRRGAAHRLRRDH